MRVKMCGPVVGNNIAGVYRYFGFEVCCPEDVRGAIEKCAEGEELVFELNSGGGSVYAGFEMYSLIRGYKGATVAEVQGIAASAASVILSACDTVKMSPVGQVMIHRASTYAEGNSRDMKEAKQMLDTIDESILEAYVEKAKGKKEREDFARMMRNETFMTAKQAVECGLADEIMDGEAPDAEERINAAAAGLDTNGLYSFAGMPSLEDLMKLKAELEGDKRDNGLPELGGVANKSTRSESSMDQIENKEQLEQQYPELTAQIKQEAAAAAAKEAAEKERSRIAGIDALAMQGFEDIIAKAKADPTKDAGAVAQEMILAQKQSGANYLTAAKKDAEAVNAVPSAAADGGKQAEEQTVDAAAKEAVAAWKKDGGMTAEEGEQ